MAQPLPALNQQSHGQPHLAYQPPLVNTPALEYIPFRPLSSIYTPQSIDTPKRTISYTCLLLPNKFESQNCTICLENSPTSYFCENHIFHDECIFGVIFAKTTFFSNRNSYLQTHVIKKDKNGFETYEGSYWTVSISEENLPTCPNCRERSYHGYFEVKIYQGEIKKKAIIDLTDQKIGEFNHFLSFPFFDKLTNIYTLFRTALAHVQQRSEMAYFIFKAQKFLMIPDLMIVLRNYSKLYALQSKKYGKRKYFNLTAIAISGVIAVSTLGFIGFINSLVTKSLTKSIDLTDLLSKLVSPEEFKNIKVSWGGFSWTQITMQFLIINRILTETALAYFSKNPFIHLGNAVLQLHILYRTSQFRWIEFERVISRDLIPKSPKNMKTMTASMRFFIPPFFVHDTAASSCMNDSSHIQSALKAINEYSIKLFQNSTWTGWWRNSKLEYDVAIQELPIDSCVCNVRPMLDSLSATSSSFSINF